jgi:hypothetical protein
MRSGGSMMPFSTHRSNVRVETPCPSAFFRQANRRLLRFFFFSGGSAAVSMLVMSRLGHPVVMAQSASIFAETKKSEMVGN